MAESVNTQIADALIEQQLQDARVEADLRRAAWAVLALLEADILAALKSTDPTQFALLARRRREVDQLMAEEIDPLIQARYAQLARQLDDAMMRLATQEIHVVQEVVNDASADNTIALLPSERRLRAGVVHGLFPSPSRPVDASAVGHEWWSRVATSVSQRIHDSLLVGVSLEENLTELTRRVRGTAENGFADGIMNKAREDAARLIRTQTTNAVSEARAAVAERNATGALVLTHVSVLDSHTSNLCLGRHGLQYTSDTHEGIGHSIPYLTGPPYHPSCRSSMVLSLRGQGAVMQETLSAWLRRRGPAFQDDVLGPTRARMFRAGTLTGRGLIDASTGKPLTLEELEA